MRCCILDWVDTVKQNKNIFMICENKFCTENQKVTASQCYSQRSGLCLSSWTMEARSRHFRWMRGKRRSGIRFTVCRITKEQLGENELCYVAWGACFYDNISTIRGGMRRTKSKLTFLSGWSNSQALPPVLLSAVLACMERIKARTPFVKLDIQQLFASR